MAAGGTPPLLSTGVTGYRDALVGKFFYYTMFAVISAVGISPTACKRLFYNRKTGVFLFLHQFRITCITNKKEAKRITTKTEWKKKNSQLEEQKGRISPPFYHQLPLKI